MRASKQVGWNFLNWELLRKVTWAYLGAGLTSNGSLEVKPERSTWEQVISWEKIPGSRMRDIGKWDQQGESQLRVHYGAGYRLGKRSPVPPRDVIGCESEGLETEAFTCQPLSSWLRVSPATLRAPSSRLYLHVGWAGFLSYRESPDTDNGQRSVHHHRPKLGGRARSCDVGHKERLLRGARGPGCSLSKKDAGVRKWGAGGCRS